MSASNDNRKEKVAYLRSVKTGGCVICGYKKCLDSLVFHHINPNNKYKRKNYIKRDASNLTSRSWRKLLTEIDKCTIVCANCHAEIHAGLHPEYLVDIPIDIDDGLPVQIAFSELIDE